jgi:phosphopantetheine--protein transferase-like protein
MKLPLPFDLKIPVLYVNPGINADPGLAEEVSRAGGLGIVDHVAAGPAELEISPGVPYGVRSSLKDLEQFAQAEGLRLILIPLEESEQVASLEPQTLEKVGVPVLVEVGSARQAMAAEKAGAAGFVARGNEGPGWVSETSGLVLLQEIRALSDLPLFLQGGVGLRTAAGARAAGATGVVLDVHLLLTDGSRVNPALKDFLNSMGLPTTVTLADVTGNPLRVYSRVGTRMVRELKKLEDSLSASDFPSYRERLQAALKGCGTSPDSDEMLLPMSEDIATAKELAAQHGRAKAIVDAFERAMAEVGKTWPFHEGSAFCHDHGTRFPIVQGPMAHVSDNPDFLAAVAAGGALPFLAMGNMPAPIAREGIGLAREKTNGRFGVGLIGLDVNRHCYEAHLEIMKDDPPPYAILAAGSIDLAKSIEEIGTACYLHCPSPSILAEGLKAGLRRFVFEGCESGGHIGTLSSLNLWNANLNVLEAAAVKGIYLSEVRVLFAGGIATGRAAAFVAGMVGGLVGKGLNVGLQMGTAYLATEEAVSTCAITSTYQKLTLESDRTVIIGRTVNTRARAAGSPMASQLIEKEQERLREGVPLRERKELYEKDNLGALRLASKGCAIDPNTATWDCPVFCDLPPEEQLNRGLYLMGQVVSLLENPLTIEQLHAEILEEGKRLFESIPVAIASEQDLSEKTEPVVEVDYEKEPIAVVGIGLRFPGSDSPDAFWQQIISGRSGIGPVPADRWGGRPDLYYDPDPKAPDKSYTRIGGFIADFEFDPLKYRIPPAVAKKMDRTQQMAVTCVADALQDAGLSPEQLKGKRVAVILGNSMGGDTTDRYAERVGLPRTLSCIDQAVASLDLDESVKNDLVTRFRSHYLENLPDITEDSLPGELANIISGRVANVFNLEGPNFTVDAACASSMAAAMNAIAALREGSIDYAVTGGVDAAMHPSSFIKFCKIGALSPDGSRPFDESANGFVMGEGAGIMILKRVSDAIRDGDRIYGTIVEIGSSSDGKGKGITAPNAAGQERAVRACLNSSRIDPASIGLIEAHGTSTAVGDKTELAVLDRLFREAGIPKSSVGVGSVKSQIGHLKAAAGAAGMIKAVLSLHHRTLPPTANVKQPNPCIDWDSSPLFLLTGARPWEAGKGSVRRAGASAFGFGGTNFHVILQEHVPGLRLVPGKMKAEAVIEFRPPDWPRPHEMQIQGEAWVIGGTDPGNLLSKVEGLLEELNPKNGALLAARCRQETDSVDIRCGFAAQDAESAAKKLSLLRDGLIDPAKQAIFPTRGIHVSKGAPCKARAGVAFLFPGQGSQYPFMLRDLAERFPVVAQTFQEADEILASLGLPTVTSAVFLIGGDNKEAATRQADAMKDTQLLQPMILTANTAIFRLLSSMGVRPVACAGHSLGEYAACVAAGVFSFRDAVEAVAVRGREMARVSIADPGLMMSIPADARVVEEVLAEVDGYVVAANKNSPKQTVISGETSAVKKAGELFNARGLDGTILPVSAAFHSGVVAPAREPFMKTLERLTVNPPAVPVLSNVTGDFYPVGPAAPGRIRDLLGKQFAAPVEWVKTLRRLYSEGIRIFLECGPKRVMSNLTLDTLAQDAVALPTNHPKKGGMLQLMETLAALAAEGIPVDFSGADGPTEAAQPSARRERAELRVVTQDSEAVSRQIKPAREKQSDPLEGLLDPEIRDIASQKEFGRFLEIQGEPIRQLIKSSFQTFVKNVLPLERTARQVKSEGMDFKPVMVSGLAAGLPSDVRFPFDKETLDDLILGRNFIKKISEDGRRSMLEKNVERLLKGPSGEVEIQTVEDLSGVIKLAGFFSDEEVIEEYGLDERLVRSMDVTTRLAIAAGLEALRDAGIPLIRQIRTTSTGHQLPDSWALPPALRRETGIIFASAFPGMASLVDEVTREAATRYGAGAKKRLIEFYTGLLTHVSNDRERERITAWFTEEFSRLNLDGSEELYTFNRDFLLRVISMGQGQMAQLVKAQGPNTHIDAACAGTTQAILLARDWIRTGQAKRVIVIAADDVAGKTLLPWVGSGFLAVGAATTNGNVSEAALPFDDRRHGLILGSAAVGMVLESQDLVKKRGMDGIATIEAGVVANSGFHGTRLDVDHIAAMMEEMIGKWEGQSGLSRHDLARDVLFMSHETYSPKRGGSSAAEVRSLRQTFGDQARLIPIANTKGFTGHTMGVGVEDVVALRCLQKRRIPPIPNLKQPDPEFSDLNLSRGGACDANYSLRLAAGFGSQIVMALYKVASREENRITDLHTHRSWLREISGYADPVVSVEQRTLRLSERSAEQVAVGVKPKDGMRDQSDIETSRVGMQTVGGAEEIRLKILGLLSDKTGYPADMLDTGLDLEADLGIDTVKQAEFISEVRDAFNIPRIDGLKIAEFPTIEHIINFVSEQTVTVSPSEASSDFEVEPQAASAPSTDGETEVMDRILELLSAKTGYPADMLDTDLDLEADLGIDTVKQAEFISEVREAFNIPRIDGLKIADFPTIKHIIGFVQEKRRKAATVDVQQHQNEVAEKSPRAEEEVRLFETRLMALPLLERVPRPEAEEVLVFGGPSGLAEDVARMLGELGYSNVKRITDPVVPESAAAKQTGLINLFPMDRDPLSLKKTFELYLTCAKTFETGPSFLVTAVSEDGAYGFDAPSETCDIDGAVAGATKAFSREYPETLARLLDLHPGLGSDQAANTIARSLTEAFPLETAVGETGELRAIRLVPTIEEKRESGIKSGDVVLASGGARGITAACISHLAEQCPLTVVILGRTSLSNRAEHLAEFGSEQWAEEKDKIVDRMKRDGTALTPVKVEKELAALRAEAEVFRHIRKLRGLGSEVIYRPVDIRNHDAVDEAIREVAETCGRVDVVLHGAGIDVSRALRSKTVEQMENVVSVKIQGMRNIMAALDRHGMPPRRVVGFGSVAGRFGNMAQVDYSAANDGLSHLLRKIDCDWDAKVSIIDWAPWSEIGMATRGSVQQSLEDAGIDFIPPQKGSELLVQDLGRSSGACEVMAAGKLGPFAADAFALPGQGDFGELRFAGQHGRILSILPREYLRAEFSLDPSHPLLDHHRIDRAAVLPGVGGMEMMRAAAALLDPRTADAMFENVRFVSPLKIFKDEPFLAEVEVVRLGGGAEDQRTYYARIFSWFVDRNGKKVGSARLHHECRLAVGKAGPSPSLEVSQWKESIWIADQDIYSVFFHGPGFRFLDQVSIEGNGKGVRFRYKDTAERMTMFTDIFPSVVEAAFQAAAVFGVESHGIMALPTGIKMAQVHSTDSQPWDGELIPTENSKEGLEGRTVIKFDGVIRDRQGRVAISLKGVEIVELEQTPGFPGKVFEEMLPVAEIVNEMEKAPEALLQQTLDDEEVREHSQKATPKRAAEWLAGRIALKRSIRRVLATTDNGPVSENSIRIIQDEQGKPIGELSGRAGAKMESISLSHSNGLAMAAAVAPGTFEGLGVDLEKVEARSDAWVQDYFTEEEIQAAEQSPQRWLELTSMWCLKEAALKAIGTGLRFDLRDINVAALDEAGRAKLEFRNEAAQHIEKASKGKFEARVEEKDGIVIARVIIRKTF